MNIYDITYAQEIIAVTEFTAEDARQVAELTGHPEDIYAWLWEETMAAAAKLGPAVHDRAWLGEILWDALQAEPWERAIGVA